MWNELNTTKEIKDFMIEVNYFHDSCIKEVKYTSGAYVDKELYMQPVNSLRVLSIIIQRQFKENSMIELEFRGLKFFDLYPVGEEYTCEISNSSLFVKDGYIYWCDDDFSSANERRYEKTVVCASNLRWRPIFGHMGNEDYFSCCK